MPGRVTAATPGAGPCRDARERVEEVDNDIRLERTDDLQQRIDEDPYTPFVTHAEQVREVVDVPDLRRAVLRHGRQKRTQNPHIPPHVP